MPVTIDLGMVGGCCVYTRDPDSAPSGLLHEVDCAHAYGGGGYARIDAHGYVTTDVMPWAAKGLLGRITVWPNKPGIQPSRQNIAARCYMHASCSYSRKRDRVSDQQILRWLFSARPLEHPSPEQRAEAKAAHRRLASEILVDVALPDASTAASSDALAP